MRLIGYLAQIVATIWMGILAWNWIEPESFLQGCGWFIVWGLGSGLASIVIGITVKTLEAD